MSALRVIVACNLYEIEYDRLGRATDEYVLAEDDDAAFGDVDDVLYMSGQSMPELLDPASV